MKNDNGLLSAFCLTGIVVGLVLMPVMFVTGAFWLGVMWMFVSGLCMVVLAEITDTVRWPMIGQLDWRFNIKMNRKRFISFWFARNFNHNYYVNDLCIVIYLKGYCFSLTVLWQPLLRIQPDGSWKAGRYLVVWINKTK